MAAEKKKKKVNYASAWAEARRIIWASRWRLLLGSVLMEAGDKAESIAQLTEGVRLSPQSAEAHNALGEAYSSFGEVNSARPEFERAVALNPEFAQAHANLGSTLLQAGENDAAAKYLPGPFRQWPWRRLDVGQERSCDKDPKQ